jgi:hypothetical protein
MTRTSRSRACARFSATRSRRAREHGARGLYFGEKISREQGIIIADTKFEFGRDGDGRIILIDEVMTPDSSRFWAADVYKPGRPQPSFDKQPLRDYLDAERRAGRWNGDAPPPPLPASVVDATSKRYLEAYRRVTGRFAQRSPMASASACMAISPKRRRCRFDTCTASESRCGSAASMYAPSCRTASPTSRPDIFIRSTRSPDGSASRMLTRRSAIPPSASHSFAMELNDAKR